MSGGRMIVIVAPSGTGKSTLIERIKSRFPELKESVSCTTRSARVGEVHGVQYYFISKEEFEKKIAQGDFLEWATVHSNFYGTSKSFVAEQMERGESVLCDIDVQGADSIKTYFGDSASVIFITPPSLESLRERLTKRATDSLSTIEERLKNAEKELERKNDYDYCVLNDHVDQAYAKLEEIILAILTQNHKKGASWRTA